MTVFEHNARARIFNNSQHPLKHSLSDFVYTHPSLPGVTDLTSAMNWIFEVLYPRAQANVANPAALPLVGNTIGDYRVVDDDGDGKAAGYQWQQREGDVAPSWYKINDMDWGVPGILSEFLLKTQDLYVYRYGYDDIDATGAFIAGTFAGQRVYGGSTANTNLTLSANSGDGVGANTGFVQVTDHFRPTAANALDIGTNALKFRTGYFGTSALIGTMTLGSGSLVDSGGTINFGATNLTTTGTMTAASFSTSSTGDFGTLHLASGSITDTSGAISFDNENLSTTGTMAALSFTAGTMVVQAGSIADSSGTIAFGATSLTNSGSMTTGQLNSDNLRLDVNTLSATNANGGIVIVANGIGIVDIQSPMTTLGQVVTGTLSVTGQLNADNLRLDGNVISSTDLNGNISLQPNGAGLVVTSAKITPSTNGSLDLGATASRFQSLYLSSGLSDGTNAMTMATLLSLRDINVAASSGMTLFYDGSKWNPSLPDTEVSHHTISDLTTFDDHTQYMFLAGRAGGQSLVGGTAASDNLNLESTSNGTKGKILTKDTFASFTDASFSGSWAGNDLGGSSNRFRHIYTAGEYFGLRLENRATDDTSSAQKIGRLWWNTTSNDIVADTGTAILRMSCRRSVTDTVWDGSTTVKNVTVSGIDATNAIWVLKDNTNDYEQMFVSIKATSTTNVRITTNIVLPAATYRLVGLE